MRIPLLVWCAVCTVAATPLIAQDWAGPVASDSTLRALVTEALTRNPGLAERRAAGAATARRIAPAGALPDPRLETAVMDLVLPRFEFNRSDFTEVDIGLSQEIPWPGTLGARTAAARAAHSGAQAELAARRREVTAGMAAAYYRLRYVLTALATLGDQQRLLEAAVQLSTTRYATGAAPQSDPLQARLARDRLAAERFTLEGEYAAALAAVNALRDRPSTDSVPVLRLDVAELRAALKPLPAADSLVAQSVASHPAVAVRRAAVEQAGQLIRVERFEGRPEFTLGARYGYRPASLGLYELPDFFSAFVGFRLPIWAGRKQHRLTDAARADSVGAEAAMHDAQVRLAREVVETRARVEAAQHRLELLADRLLPTARGAVESVLQSYQVGRAEFLTLLLVEDARFRAELEAAAVAADYQTQLVMLRQLTAEETQP